MENTVNYELIRRAQEGCSASFEELVEQQYLLVYKISYKWIGSKEDAEDITQEVFLKLAKKIQGFNEASTFQTWLYRITINTAKDYARTNSRLLRKEQSYFNNEKSRLTRNQDKEFIAENIFQLIHKLPQKLKDTALLVFGEGMNHKEASEILNCAEKTISWRVFQVKKSLKKYLDYNEVIS